MLLPETGDRYNRTMAFRTDKKALREWVRFLEAYKDRLTALGIPDVAFRSEKAWSYFIDHWYDAEYPDLLTLTDWTSPKIDSLLPVFEEMHQDGFHAGEIGGVLCWLRARVGMNVKFEQID